MAYRPFGSKRLPPKSTLKPNPDKKKPRTKTIVVDAKPRAVGRLSDAERSAVLAVVAETPGDVSQSQIEGLALATRRSPGTIADAVVAAREKLQKNLGKYVDLHLNAAEQALATNDTDVTRKAAEFMIEKISARRADGTIERLIDRTEDSGNQPRIQIGIALGGVPLQPRRSASDDTPLRDVT